MSAYENVIGGKLKLKGKSLDVKSGGITKKKKKKGNMKKHDNQDQYAPDGDTTISEEHTKDINGTNNYDEQGRAASMMTISHQQRSDISSSGRNSISRGWQKWPANLIAIGFWNSINIWLISESTMTFLKWDLANLREQLVSS